MIIQRNFYDRYTPTVAKDLLGCFLVREYRGRIIRAMITETEAYRGEYDLACHASKGRTPRTETLYAGPGTAYVYLIYGMYWMLNVVTERKDFPAAVLVRGVDIVDTAGKDNVDISLNKSKKAVIVRVNKLDGPGKLTKFLRIDRSLNGHDLISGEKLWLEVPQKRIHRKIVKTPRIGVDYAGRCKEWKWNFKLI